MIHSQKYLLASGLLFIIAVLPLFLFAQTEEENSRDTETNVTTETRVETTEDNTTTNPTTRETPPTPPRERPATTTPAERTPATPPEASGLRAVPTTTTPENRAMTADRLPVVARGMSIEERKAQMEARRLEIQANQTERREILQEKVQERISHLAATISGRMEAAIARINQVIVRIESRVEKLKEGGIDTTDAERFLTAAKTDLRTASSFLATIDVELVTALTSTEPRNAWSEVRTNYHATRDAIGSAHKNVKDAVEALKLVASAAQTERDVEVEVEAEVTTE